jgi:Tfp pilus assembly protein PilX
MRWFFIAALIAGFATAFSTHSAGVLAIGLVLAVIGVIGTLLQVLDSRMGANSRTDATLLADREVASIRAATLQARATQIKAAQSAKDSAIETPDSRAQP